MICHQASLLFALATTVIAGNTEVSSLSHTRLAVGQKFEIRTADRAYRGWVVDRSTGECQIAFSNDGETFSPPRPVFLLGATTGREGKQMLVLMHEVKVGMKMELGLGDLDQKHREITSEVKAIKIGE